MSPAGSFESLQAALQGGADAVYFGIEQLNMRARAANNFTLDDLAEITLHSMILLKLKRFVMQKMSEPTLH